MKELKNLKAEMARSGLTYEAVAEAAGAHRNTVGRWLRGETLPDVEQAYKVARLCNCSIEYLFIE
jgi:transcriptional regulator with XRE-family HTH domain